MKPRPRVLLALSLAAAMPAVAPASGKPDPSFGENGAIVMHVDRMTPTGDEIASAGLVDRHGRYVSFGRATYKPAGYFDTVDEYIGTSALITRHLPSGNLDPEFGVGGVMHLETFSFDLGWRSALELPDGKFLVAGERRNEAFANPLAPLLCRIHENGTLDTSFALNGCRVLEFFYPSAFTGISDIEMMDDGRIVVLGAAAGGATPFAVARLTPSGANDVCFGDAGCDGGGWVYGPAALADVEVQAMSLDASGAVVVAGQRLITDEPNDPQNIVDTRTSVTFRFEANGSFDSDYGIGGVSRIDYSPLFPDELVSQRVTEVFSDAGGVVVIGTLTFVKSPEESLVATARLDPAGALDMGFAANGLGLHRYDTVALRNSAGAASRQSDGKILVSGSAESDMTQSPAVLRLLPDGQPDVHFGDAGAVTIPVLADQFFIYPAAVDASGDRIVLFGGSAMEVQDFNPWLIVLDRDALFADAFETAD